MMCVLSSVLSYFLSQSVQICWWGKDNPPYRDKDQTRMRVQQERDKKIKLLESQNTWKTELVNCQVMNDLIFGKKSDIPSPLLYGLYHPFFYRQTFAKKWRG